MTTIAVPTAGPKRPIWRRALGWGVGEIKTDLLETNGRRSRNEFEYELLDIGVFNDNRYFDVFVEYAKAGPDDILVNITAANRGPVAAELHLLPTLWFRNDWASWIAESNRAAEKPNLKQIEAAAGSSAVAATHPLLGEFILSCEGSEKGQQLENVRLGLTTALSLSRHQSIKLYGSAGVYHRTDNDFWAVGIAWQFRWGGGL